MLRDPERREIHFYGRGTNRQSIVEYFHQAAYDSDFEEDFVRNWHAYLVEKAGELASIGRIGEEEAFELACTAYNTVAATEEVLETSFMRDGRVVPRVLPPTEFNRDLGFDGLDRRILHGALKPIPYQKGFYKLKSVSDCAEFVFEDSRKRSE